MKKRTWYFYFEDEYRKKHYIHSGLYKKPERTKYYKILEQMLNAGVIERYGFEVSEEHTLAYKVNQI